MLDRMPHQTAAETRRAVADAVVAVDPAAAAARAEKAHKERRIERLTQPDAMKSWWFPVPADVEHDMWSAATARANRGEGRQGSRRPRRDRTRRAAGRRRP